MKQYYAESLGWIDASATRIEVQTTTLRVGEEGEEVTVKSPVRVVIATGEAIYDRELDNETLKAALEIYRERHRFMGAEDVKRLREQYKLSQRNLARLLGWSEATINRYESGALPDRAHNLALRAISDPCHALNLLRQSSDVLPHHVYLELRERLECLLRQSKPERVRELAIQNSRPGPDEYTGYRRFASDKLTEMLLSYAQDEGFYKTKVNKLAWYSDSIHYRETSLSITGASYIRNTYGPTINQYELYLESLTQAGVLAREETFGSDGTPREKFKAQRLPDLGVFSKSELSVLERVRDHFKGTSSL